MDKKTLFIGLFDKHTKRQEVSTVEAFKIVQRECLKMGGATISEASGIYSHDDGAIVIEPTLRVELYEQADTLTFDLIRSLKALLNQESILLERQTVNTEFI